MQKLSVKAVAVAAGTTWAIAILLAGWAAAIGWGSQFVDVFKPYYIGYGPTFLGGIIGGVWAFFDKLIAGLIFALIYNKVCDQR